jgi:GntR family transcriptional regulator
VRRQLQDLVASTLRPGDALLGERQLEEQFGVSRITVRRAISDLVQDGALVRIKGKGTFVSHGLVRSTLHLASFNEDMRQAGFEPSTRVITASIAEPPAAAAEHLGLAGGEEAYQVRRLRLANGAPVSVDESWLPPRLLPDLLSEDLTGSLYRVTGGNRSPAGHRTGRTRAALPAPVIYRTGRSGNAHRILHLDVPFGPVPGVDAARAWLSRDCPRLIPTDSHLTSRNPRMATLNASHLGGRARVVKPYGS